MNCHHSLKNNVKKMMNFVKSKRIVLSKKILCENDANKLSSMCIKSLKIRECIFTIDFSVNLAFYVLRNRFQIQRFAINFFHHSDNQKSKNGWILKNLIILLKALSFCKSLKVLDLSILDLAVSTRKMEISWLPFFIAPSNLIYLQLSYLKFNEGYNFEFFKMLKSLRKLILSSSQFTIKSFVELMTKLLNCNKITEISLAGLNGQGDYSNSSKISKAISNEIAKKMNSSLKLYYFNINYSRLVNSKSSANFIEFIDELFYEYLKENNSLTYLNYRFSNIEANELIHVYCQHITRSVSLKELRQNTIFSQKENTEALLQAFELNKSIEKFELYSCVFRTNIEFLHGLLKTNCTLKIIHFVCCININEEQLIQGLNANTTLIELNFRNSNLSKELCERMMKLNIEKIEINQVGLGDIYENQFNARYSSQILQRKVETKEN